MTPDRTVDLILRAKAGNHAALEELCYRYTPRLKRWAHGRPPSWSRQSLGTDDLVQDALSRVVARLEEFKPLDEAAFQGYVRQALLNLIRDEVSRARGTMATPFDRDPIPALFPVETVISAELFSRYEMALQRVKDEDREAIIARVEMGLSWEEIAEALGKASNVSAEMTVKRALVRLAREMSHEARP